jgi:hypothetical protein
MNEGLEISATFLLSTPSDKAIATALPPIEWPIIVSNGLSSQFACTTALANIKGSACLPADCPCAGPSNAMT